jgi:hypothetical protein
LASSCTLEGKDDSNLTFVDLLSRLTVSEARALDFVCKNAEKQVATGGWLMANEFEMSSDELQRITGVSDVHRLDLELDHLRSLGLIDRGFELESQTAKVMPMGLGLQMYARCHGYSGSPVSFFGLATAGSEEDVLS